MQFLYCLLSGDGIRVPGLCCRLWLILMTMTRSHIAALSAEMTLEFLRAELFLRISMAEMIRRRIGAGMDVAGALTNSQCSRDRITRDHRSSEAASKEQGEDER